MRMGEEADAGEAEILDGNCIRVVESSVDSHKSR
jgi:hypothetical protein